MSEDLQYRICPNCHVALLYPHTNPELIKNGWFECELCSYCCIIEKEIYTNRIKKQK